MKGFRATGVACQVGLKLGVALLAKMTYYRTSVGNIDFISSGSLRARMNGAANPPLRFGIRLFPAAVAALARRITSE